MACGGCILVVDDEADIREVVREFLESLGCRVVLAVDGLDALDRLARGPTPCMILLDLMMPRLDGASLARQLREDPHLRSVPVISMSASGRLLTPPLVVQHLEKPFCLDAVAAPITRYCRRSRSID
jgi:CheY-like chemotaxis protein